MAKAPGPDQAASWVIAVAACITNTLLSGISRGTAVFYVALIEVYGATRLQANLPFSLRNGVRNVLGPVVGLLGQKYGVRIVTLIGGIFATIGIALCTVAPSVMWISIFWGCFHGLGVALANTLFQVTINQYFVKYRATAAGLALSGACAGSFFFPVTLEIFVDTYGLNGAFLLTSGIIMQVIPAGLLLTEPPWMKKPRKTPEKKTPKQESIKNKDDHLEKIVVNFCPSQKKATTALKDGPQSDLSTTGEGKHSEGDHEASVEKDAQSVDEKFSNLGIVKDLAAKNGVVNSSFVGSVPDLSEAKCSDKPRGFTLMPRDARTLSTGELSAVIPVDMDKRARKGTILNSVIKVYCNPMFYMISFSVATFGLLFDPLVTVIMDYINDKGMDERAGKYLISVMSVGDLVGRMCFGWVTDREFMTVPKFMVLNQFLQGLSFVLLPTFYTFEVLMGLVIIYGVAAGTEIVMFPILVGKYLPNEQSLAIGCIAFFGGLMSFVTPPLIGHFRDNAGSYDGMFYITGSLELAAACLWLLEPFFLKFVNSKSIGNEGSVHR